MKIRAPFFGLGYFIREPITKKEGKGYHWATKQIWPILQNPLIEVRDHVEVRRFGF